MKKIDQLLVRSFILPFVATFCIALFVLIMQFLWIYIDDIIGKGAGFWMLVELLSYLSMSLVPTALPIAVLISSVMVMGNLAEFYELASLKSAGVSLIRVMLPLMWVVAGISVFSYFCSNNIIPVANLQFKSRLYDIRKQKPAMSLETGVFNEDFQDFVIHIGKKSSNNRDIEDVIIYDHRSDSRKPMQILAKKGEMYTTKDQHYFIMNLYDGHQYQETEQVSTNRTENYPFIRTSFTEWTKVFDLSEFEINRTDSDLFGSHYSMLTSSQLLTAIDSLDMKVEMAQQKLNKGANRYFWIFKDDAEPDAINNDSIAAEFSKDTSLLRPLNINVDSTTQDEEGLQKDSSFSFADSLKTKPAFFLNKKNKKDTIRTTTLTDNPLLKNRIEINQTPGYKQHLQATTISRKKPPVQKITKPLPEYSSIGELFESGQLKNFYSKAQSYARNMQGLAMSANREFLSYKESEVKHIYELHIKFSLATVCFIFLFIGAPMGAIVRKGGFGYPILISIVFFMIFIILNIFSKKLSETFIISAQLGAWMPCIILFPVGLLLTHRAMKDAKMLNTDRIQRIFAKLTQYFNYNN